MKYIETALLFLTALGVGLKSEVAGSTVEYLKRRIDLSYEQLSHSLMAMSVGEVTGHLLAGFLFKKFSWLGSVWLCVSHVVGGLVLGYIPWSPSLAVLICLHFLSGFCRGNIVADVLESCLS